MLHRQTGLKRLIFAHAAAGRELPPINEYTVTGNPAEFNTNLARPLQSFEIPFSPVQSGSGTPSPSNVRPISGWAGVTINANGNLVMMEWQSVAGVVYGGVLDAVTGILTITQTGLDVTRSNFPTLVRYSVTQGAFVCQFPRNGNPLIPAYVATTAISNRFSQSIDSGPGRLNTTAPYVYVFLPFDELTEDSVNGAWAWFDAHPTLIVFELTTPQKIQLSPVEVKTIVGQNSIGTNINGTNTIKYLKRG